MWHKTALNKSYYYLTLNLLKEILSALNSQPTSSDEGN
jgi:hypothetical protein